MRTATAQMLHDQNVDSHSLESACPEAAPPHLAPRFNYLNKIPGVDYCQLIRVATGLNDVRGFH